MITFSYDPATRIRTATYTGVVTDEEFLGSYAALTAEPDYDAGADDLVDLRPVERLEITAEAMRHLIDLFQPVDALCVPTRCAIVAASDFTYGMSRMYTALRGDEVPEEVQVFRSIEEARGWLKSRVAGRESGTIRTLTPSSRDPRDARDPRDPNQEPKS